MVQADRNLQSLVDQGEFGTAEELLRQQISDLDGPAIGGPAVQLEILRRTRHDFSLAESTVLAEVRKSIPDATVEDLRRWRESNALQSRTIDGQVRYFRRAVSNLYRFSPEAKRRRDEHADASVKAEKKFEFTKHIAELVRLSDATTESEVFPVHHHVVYGLSIKEGHPRLKAGAKVRAWLPFPQHYRQQRDVKLLGSEPAVALVADNGAPHRTLYFEQTIGEDVGAPTFRAEFEFVTSAYCPKLDKAQVEPYDLDGEIYRQYTAERLPHLELSSDVRSLAAQVVQNESNPLAKAVRIFRWVSENIPWCGEMEYCIIPNLSAKGLRTRRGDCGVQGMTFIALCRAAGVPARWQSGWETKPGEENMHDWSEIYIKPWGWLPVDASYGVRKHSDPRVQNFLCGNMDAYRLIVNLDYARELQPAKTSFRSEPNDFQRGEVEIDGHNLYFDEWSWSFKVQTKALTAAK